MRLVDFGDVAYQSDGLGQAGREVHGREPAELALQFAGSMR